MPATDFGQPTNLLIFPPASAPATQPTPMLPVPSPPSFADFKFRSIGKQPELLKRFSEPQATQGSVDDEAMSISSESEQNDSGRTSLPRTRPSLWQALTEPESAVAVKPPVNDNLGGQSSVNSSSPQVVQAAAPPAHILNHVLGAEERPRQGDPSSVPATNSQTSVAMTSSFHTDERQASNNISDSMQLRYPSPSPGPGSATERSMAERGHLPLQGNPSSPVTRKYDGLRQIQARLQSHLLNSNSPNLASAALLVESAHLKAAAIFIEARRVYNFSQDAFNAAQKSLTVAKTILSAAEEVKGLVEGAKSELERVSSKDTNQDHDLELNEILGSMNDWISGQEADDAASRLRRAQHLNMRKKLADPARVVDTPQRSVASLYHPSDPQSQQQATGIPPRAARVTSKQPLFFSPTPEVDVKVEPQSWSQSPIPSTDHATGDLAKRQATLRRQLEEKRRLSAEIESRGPSPSQSEQPNTGHREEPEGGRDGQMEEERRREEQRRKEVADRQETERVAREAQEILKVHEKALREKEEKERREKAEARRKAQETAEAAKRVQEEEAARKAREEAVRKAQEEAVRKAQEELEKKAKKAREMAKAQEEAKKRREDEERRMTAFLVQQKQEQERGIKEAEEIKRRAREEEQAKEQRMLQEQAQKKAERKRDDDLRQEQEVRRQQILADKNRTMADRAQQIRAERESRYQTSPDMNIGISSKSNPGAPHIPPTTSNHSIVSNVSASSDFPPVPLAAFDTASPALLPPLALHPPPRANVSTTRENASAPSTHNEKHASSLTGTTAFPPRNLSLPPVAHLSPDDSVASPDHVPSPLSVHRHSGDTGNVPFAQNPGFSPQAQVANLRHVVNALQLPPLNLSVVKREPDQNDSQLLHTGGKSTNGVAPRHPPPPQTQQPLQRVETQTAIVPSQTPTSAQPHPPHSRPGTSYEPHIPSSTTDTGSDVRGRPQQVRSQNWQQPPVKSVSGANLQGSLQNSVETRDQPQSLPVSISPHSRSTSPLRMGPDVYTLPSPVESDGGSGTREPLLSSRIHNETSAHPHWDHFSPSPPARLSPRLPNVYRPYLSRPSSPVMISRKRSRDHSPPLVRDYRDYDERRLPPPRRRSRSPPPRRNRRLSLSRSPPLHQGRPPLASRLTPNLKEDFNPPSAPRDSSRPELLDRFTEPRLSNPTIPANHPPQQARLPPTRPGRGRVKRGRGGGGPITGPSHASLEKRISSGATLMRRLEDPPRL